MSTAASPADPLGYDMRYVDGDLDPTGAAATGIELVEEAVINRLSCGRLPLIGAPGDEVEYGEDVRLWVAEALTEASAAAKGPRISIVLQRDQRISRADAMVTLAASDAAFSDGSSVDITIELTIVLVNGVVLDRIVGISQVTVDFLAQGN